jgi:hypothetical protein
MENLFTETLCCLAFYNTGRWTKSILSVIHHRQNPLESTWTVMLVIVYDINVLYLHTVL